MHVKTPDSPALDDASARAATGKTMAEWLVYLDQAGGLAQGRRELVSHLYSACRLDEWWATTLVVEYEKARGAREKDGLPKGYSICSTKTVAAPLAAVFAAFGEPRWLGAGGRAEFRDGGRFETADGDRGCFLRLRAGKNIRIGWERADLAPGSQVEVLFADKGQGKTGITLNHTRIQERRAADALRAGWAEALAALKRQLEAR